MDELKTLLAKAGRCFLTLAMLTALIPALALTFTAKRDIAYAADGWAVGQTYYGNCYIGNYTMVGNQSYFNMGNFDGKLGELGIGNPTFVCVNATAANPYPQTAPYSATVTEIDVAGNRVKFSVVVTPKDATDGTTSNGAGLVGYQRVGADVWLTVEFKGDIELTKTSADTALTAGNPLYSLEGAKYGIFSDAACTTLVEAITTDAQGHAKSGKVAAGTYYVKEMSPSPGYSLDTAVYTVAVTSGATARVNGGSVLETPQSAQIDLLKKSANAAVTDKNSAYSLTGATYKVYKDAACTHHAATLTTDSSGYAKSGALPLGTYYVKEETAPKGYAPDSAVYAVTLATGGQTVRVGDVAVYDTPKTNPATDIVSKRDSEGAAGAQGGATFAGAEFTLKLYDGQYTTATSAEASGKLLRTWVLRTDAAGIAKLSDAYKVSGDTLYKNAAGDAVLPIGTLTVQETKAPAGYQINSAIAVRNITDNSTTETITSFKPVTGQDAITETVMRGDLKLVKVRAADQQRLANVAFRITSQTTGESHIAVTDANGMIDTSATYNAHTQRTNANDAAVAADGTVDVSKLDATAGIWFGKSDAIGNSRGALLYDTYTISELSVPANAGLELVTIKNVVLSRDSYTIDLGTVDNYAAGSGATIKTAARDFYTGTQTAAADEQTRLVDRVEYTGLTPTQTDGSPSQYVIKTTLMDRTTGSAVTDATGNPVSAQTVFTPAAGSGYAEVTLAFDAAAYAGRDVVFFEELYAADEKGNPTGSALATHKDIDDFAQTVHLAAAGNLHTVARAADGSKQAAADTQTTLIDRVYYSGLCGDGQTTYRLRATLVDVQTNQTVRDPAGNPIQATAYFQPTATSGYVDVELEFDARDFAGRHVVFFEELYRGDSTTAIATHKDINDYNQTISLLAPTLESLATDATTGEKTLSATTARHIKDTLTYTNLVSGRTYTVYTQVKQHEFTSTQNNGEGEGEGEGGGAAGAGDATGKTAGGDETSAQSANYTSPSQTTKPQENNTAQVGAATDTVQVEGGYWTARDIDDATQTFTHTWQFTPVSANGTIEFDIPIDTSQMHGKSLVVYQEIYDGDALIVAHKDASSLDQSVFVQSPAIVSDLQATAGDDKQLHTSKTTTLTDTIAYTNTATATDYTYLGMLIDPETRLPHTKDGTDVNEETLKAFMQDIVKTFGNAEGEGEGGTAESDSRAVDSADKGDADVSTFPKTKAGLDAIFSKYSGLKRQLILASSTFTTTDPQGSAQLTYSFDSTHLSGKKATSVVLLERSDTGVIEATEPDLTNPYQTVEFVSESITTQAFDKSDVDQTLNPGADVVVTDKVTYTNLRVGETYVIEGKLYDKQTGRPLQVDGKEVTARTEFTAIAANGSALLDFSINTAGLQGKELVVFERLYRKVAVNNWEGTELAAAHEDLSDLNQTVTVSYPQNTVEDKGEGEGGAQTGSYDSASEVSHSESGKSTLARAGDKLLICALATLAAAGAIAMYAARKKEN